jgi:iron(III) transport system ATP-binding protein
MRMELKRLQRQLGITSVYVTHDQVEALAMSSRIAVMKDGAVQQMGKPRDIYEQPASRFVADFIGTSNFIEGQLAATSDGGAEVTTAAGAVRLAQGSSQMSGSVVLAIRPEDVEIRDAATGGAPMPGELSGRVEARAFLGESVEHVLSVGGLTLRARCHPSVSLPESTEVLVRLSSAGISVLPTE